MTWLRARDGVDPLHAATEADDPIVLAQLLEGGAVVGAVDLQQRTALHLAALQGSVRCTRLLLVHGAPVDAQDNAGCTPLTRAVQAEPPAVDVITELRAHGADPWVPERSGRSPRAWAAIAATGDLMPDLPAAVPAWSRQPWLGESDPLRADEVEALVQAVDGVVAHNPDLLLPNGLDDLEQLYTWTKDYGPYPRVHLRRPMGPVDTWDISAMRHADGSASVDVEMWTREHGPSELTLSLWLEPSDTGAVAHINGLRVM